MAPADILCLLSSNPKRYKLKRTKMEVSKALAPMGRTAKLQTLSRIYWDYDIDAESYLDILENRRPSVGWRSADRIFVRMLESLRWYQLVAFFGPEELSKLLTDTIIAAVRSPHLRRRYESARRILRGSDPGRR